MVTIYSDLHQKVVEAVETGGTRSSRCSLNIQFIQFNIDMFKLVPSLIDLFPEPSIQYRYV